MTNTVRGPIAAVLSRVLAPALVATVAVPGAGVILASPAMAETVCSKQGTELDFAQAHMANTRAKLENTGYFGPGGAVAPETIDFAALATVTEAGLVGAGCDIFLGGGFNGSLTAAEGAELVNWVQGPRDAIAIGGCDMNTSNQTCLAFGRTLTDIPNGGVSLNRNLAYNPLTCGGANGVETYGGRSTFIGLGPSGTDIELAHHNTASQQPAVTTDNLVDPTVVFTADADMFGSSGSGPIGAGPIAASDQGIFILNIFKFALDGLKGRLANPQCYASYNETVDLELALATPDTVVPYGTTTTATVQVGNVLGPAADAVQVSVPVPAGFVFVSASGPGSYDAATGVWTVGTVAPGAILSLDLTLRAAAGGTVPIRAEIVRSSLPDPDSAPNETFGTDDMADGQVDDDEAQSLLTVPPFDLSDAPTGGAAPDGAGTALYGEAAHGIVPGLHLGATPPDADTAPQTDATADADDASGGDDEDGAAFPALAPGTQVTIPVSVTGPGFLQAWIDWDGNGVFDGIEQVARDLTDADGDGTIPMPLSVPAGAVRPFTFARLRWSSDFGAMAEGYAPDGEVEDHRVSIAATGTVIAGRLFRDDGSGGGTAHDAARTGAEAGGAFATVTLLDDGGTVIAAPVVGPDGAWSHILGTGHSGALSVVAQAQGGHLFVSEATGSLPGLANPDGEDGRFTFTPAPGQDYRTLDIGLVAAPALDDDNTAVAAAGQALSLAHRYRATSTGTVSFSFADERQTPAGSFSTALFEDAGCDGTPDSLLSGPRAVAAGQVLCLVSRVSVSGGAGPGARLFYRLIAATTFAGIGTAHSADDTDTVTVGNGGDQVVLTKTVRNITTGEAEGTVNLGDIGDVLEYRITLRNAGAAPVTEITVNDRTPVYTALSDPAPALVSIAPGMDCALSAPVPNQAGYSGAIAWQCSGSFPGGGEGSLAFRVRIAP